MHRLAVQVVTGIAKDVAVLAVNEDETLALLHTLRTGHHASSSRRAIRLTS